MDNLKIFTAELKNVFPELFASASEFEQIGVALCLAPMLAPDMLEQAFKEEAKNESSSSSLGGIPGQQHRGLFATGETLAHFYCNGDLQKRIDLIRSLPAYLSEPEALLHIEAAPPGEPFLSGKLALSNYCRNAYSGYGILYEQRISQLNLGGFIHSNLELEDLVLPAEVLESLEEITDWEFYFDKEKKPARFARRMKKGLKVLFYGKPGTGKSETASILGKRFNRQIYRIDLAQVVSKYIGETEKNLSRVFELAESRDWILFFDEGDALFGRRTSINSSNDRYANQETAYLLQRIEDFDGILIVSSNSIENIDSAYQRRFHIMVEFSMPDQFTRSQIWEKLLNELGTEIRLSPEEWDHLALTDLSGGNITNVVQYAYLKTFRKKQPITFPILKSGIVRELRKENRLMSL